MQDKVTVWQRAFMLTLLNAQRDIDTIAAGVEPRPVAWVSRRAIEYALWADWQAHHTNKANELIALGWVRQMKISGVIYYTLSDNALAVLEGQWQGVQIHRWVQWNGQAPEQMLPGCDEVPF